MRTLIICPSIENDVGIRLSEFIRSSPGFRDPLMISYADSRDLTGGFELIIVCLAKDSDASHDIIRRMRERAEAPIIAVGPINDSKLILRTLQLGADLFLDQIDPESDLVAALIRLFPKLSGKLPTGRVFAVMSASGGCGASTLSVNLAAVLAQSRGKCGLIDLNPGRSDLSALLDLKPQFNLNDACQNETRFDRAMLEKMLVRHACGIELLGSSTAIDAVRSLTPTGVSQVVTQFYSIFPDTVIDLEDCVHSEQIEALRHTGVLFLVCRLDFTCMRNARRILDRLKEIPLFQGTVKIVINKQGQASELPLDDALEVLGTEIAAVIPYEPSSINASNNTGTPLVLKFPDSAAAQAIKLLVRPPDKKRSDRSGFLERIKSFMWRNPPRTVQPLTAAS